jgi:type I restriction enzyme S subunit
VSEWLEVKLGSVVESVSETFKFTDKQVIFLNTSDILADKFLHADFSDPKTLPGQAKKRIKKGDLLFSEIRPANKRYALVNFNADDYVVSTKLMVLRSKGNIDPTYLKLFLTSEETLDYLQMIAEDRSGTFPQITFDILNQMDLMVPPLSEQKAIASVLSSLDDKIDLLHRQNTTLERMAETLFRQWFVEEAQEDWEGKPLSFYGEIICGKTPSKQNHDYFNGDVPFIKIPDMHGNAFIFKTEDSLTELGKNSQSNKTLPALSICVSCIATVGLVSLTIKSSQTNQQINSIIPKHSKYRYFLYLTMKASYELLHAEASGGTATLNLNTGNFSRIAIPLPPENLLLEFEKVIEPAFNKIYQNQSQIQTLEKLRDNLLPKLMSGEIRIQYA